MSARAIPFDVLSCEMSGYAKVREASSAPCFDAHNTRLLGGKWEERLTVVARAKLIVHHALDDELNVSRVRRSRTVVHCAFVDALVRCMASLEYVECATHVALGQLNQRFLAVFTDCAAKGGGKELAGRG